MMAVVFGLVVMGVSGCGKSTLGQAIAADRGVSFLEGDAFHPVANVAKMSAGTPLTDDDRWPWLDHLGHSLGEAARTEGFAVAACSALKRAYRERLTTAAGVPLRFVCLNGSRDLLFARMAARQNHYMPPSLLDSQIATLELPGADEDALILDIAGDPAALTAAAKDWLGF